MNTTPNANRKHIGIYGNTNSGKSSLMNKILGQDISLVSNVEGTTTDPVQKAMELIPFGPVLLIDTAGLEDKSQLGEIRVKKSFEYLKRLDFAIYVVDGKNLDVDTYKKWKREANKYNIKHMVVVNKLDRLSDDERSNINNIFDKPLFISAKNNENIDTIDIAHPSGSVDPGCQPKGGGHGSHRASRQPCQFHQRPDTRTGTVRQQLQTMAHQGAVIMGQGHDIGDGTQCRQVAIVLDHLIAVVPFQGADQLERHTHAGQPLEWAGTIGAMRVHHRHCIGQGLPGLVMVGHHHINAQTVGMGDLLMGRNAVIHCDDQPDPPDIVQEVDGFGIEAIALLLPVGDIVDHIGAHRLQIAVQQRCGGDAVAIVVAVDHDEFA